MNKKMKKYFVSYRFQQVAGGMGGYGNIEIETKEFGWMDVAEYIRKSGNYYSVLLLFWAELPTRRRLK